MTKGVVHTVGEHTRKWPRSRGGSTSIKVSKKKKQKSSSTRHPKSSNLTRGIIYHD